MIASSLSNLQWRKEGEILYLQSVSCCVKECGLGWLVMLDCVVGLLGMGGVEGVAEGNRIIIVGI